MDIEELNIGQSMTIQMIKSAIKVISPALSIPIELYDNYQNTVQYNNIVDVLKSHEAKLTMLSDIVINKLYMQTPVYAKDILLTIQKAKDELNGNKRELYAQYLTACCHINNKNDFNKELYLDYIGRIDFLDFFILKKMSNLLNNRNSISWCRIEFNEFYHTNYSENDIKIHYDHLMSLGLIERCDKEEYEAFQKKVRNSSNSYNSFKSKNLFQKTSLGKALYEFISKT